MAAEIRIALDTSVLVAAMRSRVGASAAVLYALGDSNLRPLASPALFLEYEAVLKREKHSLKPEQVDGLLSELANLIEPVQIRFFWRPLLTDANDEMVIEAAINGHAHAIVTHNGRDFESAAPR